MLAIIPARGGSKGIPRKNICPLAGRPLIDYAIKAALASAEIHRVIVTTDDREIADVARQCGAEVPFPRPSELATDTIPNGAACLHVIDALAATQGDTYDTFALIQTTTPFVHADDFGGAISLFNTRQPAAVVSLSPFETPVEAVFEIGEDGELVSVLRHVYGVDIKPATRQSFGPRYVTCGAITVVRVDRMRRDPNYFFTHPNVLAYPIPPERSLDIDTPQDLMLAEHLMQARHSTARYLTP